MKLLIFVLAATVAFSAGWETVERIPVNSKIVVQTNDNNLHGTFVSANESAVVFHTKSGEQSLARGDVRRVRVADPSRRMRNGAIATAIGAGIGLGIGVAVCPYCRNEGSGWKYTGPLTAIGAGVGASGFIPLPYRTIYKDK